MTFKSQKDYLNYLKTKKVSLEKRVNYAGEYLEKQLGKKFQSSIRIQRIFTSFSQKMMILFRYLMPKNMPTN